MSRSRHNLIRAWSIAGLRGRRASPPLLWLALAAFALRALIPIGFMPAADGTLSLTVCDEGLPAWLLPHPHTAASGHAMPAGEGHHSRADHCPFCGATTPAPGPLLLALACAMWVAIASSISLVCPRGLIRLLHVPQARAPPLPV